MIRFTLPWPANTLSPNARQHLMAHARAKKSYRHTCWGSVLEQRVRVPQWPAVDVLLGFVTPDDVDRDRDNLMSRMKAGLDGLCDAWQINDRRFARVSGEVLGVAPTAFDAHVKVIVREHAKSEFQEGE